MHLKCALRVSQQPWERVVQDCGEVMFPPPHLFVHAWTCGIHVVYFHMYVGGYTHGHQWKPEEDVTCVLAFPTLFFELVPL